MKYAYELKFNGVWYKAGEEVPTSTPVTSVEVETKTEETTPSEKPSRGRKKK